MSLLRHRKNAELAVVGSRPSRASLAARRLFRTLAPVPPGEVTVVVGASIFGRVTDSVTGSPLNLVTVTVVGISQGQTGKDGHYLLGGISFGTRTVTYVKDGYVTESTKVVLVEGQNRDMGPTRLVPNTTPPPAPPPTLSSVFGTVKDSVTGAPIASVSVIAT